MGRAGAFSANFDPDNLDAFRSFCGGRGEKYTKVLEQLALAYIESNGELISNASLMPVPGAGSTHESHERKHAATSSKVDLNALEERLSKLEEDDQETKESFGIIFERLMEVEKATNCGRYSK